jgi:hypothetical protein
LLEPPLTTNAPSPVNLYWKISSYHPAMSQTLQNVLEKIKTLSPEELEQVYQEVVKLTQPSGSSGWPAGYIESLGKGKADIKLEDDDLLPLDDVK